MKGSVKCACVMTPSKASAFNNRIPMKTERRTNPCSKYIVWRKHNNCKKGYLKRQLGCILGAD